MSLLGTFTQQPNEVMDYDLDFSNWLPIGDTVSSVTLSVSPSMTMPPSYAINASGTVVKVWVYAGGVNGTTYKITARATTAEFRVKEAEIKVKVKEI